MAAPYLIEVRLGGEVKQELREIIYDVADRFNVQGAARPRAVPHVTLYGPYNTNRGGEVKKTLASVCSAYDVVPFRIEGFGAFSENNVIYANVVLSSEMRSLRRDISRELRPLTYNHRPWDSNYFYEFHITIAFKDVGAKFDAIWEYVTDRYSPSANEYAIRISSLRRRAMLWEYDLLQNAILDSDTATSATSWELSLEMLEARQSNNDHEGLVPKPRTTRRYMDWGLAKLRREW